MPATSTHTLPHSGARKVPLTAGADCGGDCANCPNCKALLAVVHEGMLQTFELEDRIGKLASLAIIRAPNQEELLKNMDTTRALIGMPRAVRSVVQYRPPSAKRDFSGRAGKVASLPRITTKRPTTRKDSR